MAVWAKRSIRKIGYERDFYVHMNGGIPVSVETAINRRVETPISQSDTWTKIVSGRTDALDATDRPVLYALIRHLEVRTPHYQATMEELTQMAVNPDSDIPFTDEERAFFTFVKRNRNSAKAMLNYAATTIEWTETDFKGAGLAILRSPIPLRSSTVPVLSIGVSPHPAIEPPLPGITPYQSVLTLNRTTIASLTPGDFDGAFLNQQINHQTALAFNRRFVMQFSMFDKVRHLITNRENLADDMTWAPYDVVKDDPCKMIFRRKGSQPATPATS